MAARAAADPARRAVVGDGVEYSYGELVRRADALAAALAERGVGTDDVVVLALERSVHWVAGMLAAWKVGAAYAPVDPTGPVRRIEALVTDTGAAALLGRPEWLAEQGIGDDFAGAAVLPVSDAPVGEVPALPLPQGRADRLAYVISTSGSTGRPKPTMVPMGGVENTVGWYREQLALSAGEGVLIASAPTFDLTQKNVWAGLASGATLHLADAMFDPRQILAVVAAESIAVMNTAPSAFEAIVDADETGALAALRVLFLGGEVVKLAPLRALIDGGLRVVNSYGPTEACDVVSFHEVTADERGVVPIGRAVPGVDLYVLTDRLAPAPVGVPGELYIGGIAVGRGYGAMAGQTADRFVADPFATDGSRLYRTGDLVRWTADGELDYLGRTDFQIKLRGLRIELGEIESVLAQVPGVDRAAAVVATGPDGGEHLVAYVSPGDVDLDAIKAAAYAELPGYMVPTVWTVVDDIALSPSGKVDRQALPPVEFAAVRAEYVAPETEAETAVAAVFAEILGVDRVSVTERFFDLGGNSLSAMRLAARAEQALGASISVRDVFEAPTVRGLAAVAANADRSAGQLPLTFGQQRLWFDDQLGAGTGRANLALTLQLAGPLDLTALHRAVLDVTARQGALRTTFPTADGMPYQAIDDAETAAPRIDWAVAASQAEVDDAVRARFDLTADYPFRVRVLTEGPGEHAVTLVTHPIVADSRSWLPLAADLVAAYDARRDGTEPAPTPLPIEYADYARWQHRELGAAEDPTSPAGAQLDYWTGALAGLPETTGLPTDRPRPAVASGRGAVVRTQLPAATVAALRAAAGAHETGEFTVVHTALAVLLSRLGAGTDLAIGTPTTGRVRPELDALVGAFDNMVVLRSRLDDAASFDDLLAATAAVEAEAFGRADVPFETVVDAVAPVRSTAFASLAQVWLTLDASLLPETFDPAPLAGEAAGLTVSPGPRRDVGSRADLLISVDSGAADWTVEVRYATDLYDESTAIRFGDRLVRLLAALLADTAAPVAGAAMDAPAAAAAVELDPHPLPMTAPTSDAVLFAGTGTPAVTLADLLAAAVERHGPRPAVADPDGRLLTYAQLDTAADALARTLITRGIGAETTVVVVADRSATLLTAIWAIAKTGGAYLAVDPATPVDRIADAARTCGAVLGLAATAADVPDGTELPWLRLDDESIAATTPPIAAEPVRPARFGNTAYVSLTADGQRAVAVTHAGVANLAAEQSRRAGVDEYCRVLGHAAPSSAAFTGEYLLAAIAGATLVFGPDSDGDALAEFMMRQGITHALLSPTVLATLDPATLHSLRVVYAGGDELTVELKDQWALMRRIQNVYGTAETTGAVTISEPLPLGATVDLGGPVDGVGLLVLDDRLAPVAPDTDGDLYVVGGALARGYLGQAGLTADRFVANPFGTAGQRMFRTGDVVRRRTGDLGQTVLEYVGRRADRPATAPGEDAALAAGAGAPANVAEERVAAIVADLLGSDRVSLTESFLALGGNPLLASRAAARISEALGASVTMGAVLEAESLRALVGSVDTRGAALPPVTAVVPRPDVIPLSFAQQRMWFINQFEPSLGTYNIPSVVRLSGALNVDAMRAAFADVLARHEVLRTTFPSVDGRPVQQIAPVAAIADQLDWAVVDSQRAVEEAVTGGFDVARQWPIRVRLWPMNADGTEHVLAVVVHHIAADGESTGPLLTDVVLAYLARAAGHAPEFAPLEVQFADFALWQHTELGSPDDPASVVGGQLRYWARQLAGLPDVLDLPADRPRPLVASQEGASVGFEIPAEVAARVAALAADRGLSAFMVVHAALAAVLTRLSATDDVAVSTPVAGRGQRVLDPLVGMFVNTLILRTEVTPSTTFDELLEQVRTTDLDAMSHADVPFESIVDALKPTRSEAFAPLAQVMLTFDQSTLPELNTGGDTIDLGGLMISPVDPPEQPAKGDLTIGVSVADTGQPWPGVMVYATDLFDEATVRRFAERLVTVLSEVVVAPGTPVYDVVLTSPEEQALIEGWGTGQSVQIECETVVSGMEELR
ncbi:MAG: amino acid adenylation domain-containing protein [Gordonia sp. (in: high G+C Gram-positive bacteria)]